MDFINSWSTLFIRNRGPLNSTPTLMDSNNLLPLSYKESTESLRGGRSRLSWRRRRRCRGMSGPKKYSKKKRRNNNRLSRWVIWRRRWRRHNGTITMKREKQGSWNISKTLETLKKRRCKKSGNIIRILRSTTKPKRPRNEPFTPKWWRPMMPTRVPRQRRRWRGPRNTLSRSRRARDKMLLCWRSYKRGLKMPKSIRLSSVRLRRNIMRIFGRSKRWKRRR